VLQDGVAVNRASVGREAHELVLAAVDLETAVIGERGVEEPERMGEADLASELQMVAVADTPGGRGPFPDAIEGEDGGTVEGAGKEGAGGVALVVVGEDQLGAPGPLQLGEQRPLHVQLLPHPDRDGHAEARETRGRVGEIGFDQPLELHQRLLVEGDVVEIGRLQPPGLEAVLDRVDGKTGVVFAPAEALLLGRRHDAAVHHQRRGAVVVKRGNAQNACHRFEGRNLGEAGKPAQRNWKAGDGGDAGCGMRDAGERVRSGSRTARAPGRAPGWARPGAG
jgi:hypothetical protein